MSGLSRNGRWSCLHSGLVIALAPCIALLAPLAAATVHPARAAPTKPAKELVRLVRHDCGSCHGLTLKGGLGKPLLPENLAGRDAETIARIILDGIPGTPMPPWRGILSERDALWIARKLKEGFPHAAP